MALRFRLQGLAETFIEEISCPSCGKKGNDDEHFATSNTRVTYDGIVVVAECKSCGEIFVPSSQRCGVINTARLREAVEQDSLDTGEPIYQSLDEVRLDAERLNALQKGREMH